MQTSINATIRATPEGQEADRIIRSCVHCGFCTATCPTYGILGNELDSPRGRIYLIKDLLEESPVSRYTQQHLDRCLTCRACETTCPSGVEYGRLLDIGRQMVEQRVGRSWVAGAVRLALRRILPFPHRYAWLLTLGQTLRYLLPPRWRRLLSRPGTVKPSAASVPAGTRRMLLLDGCVQTAVAPGINAAATKLLAKLNITAVPMPGCCGALSQHLACPEEARDFMRQNIDRWWPALEQGAEAIVSTASGCGVMVKDYGYLLRDDPEYADRAREVAARSKDMIEVLAQPDLLQILRNSVPATGQQIAFQAPCTLQHGQRLAGRVEALLHSLGFRLTEVTDAHLCCGSAGTYSLLQPVLAKRLALDKLANLCRGDPERIATANIGCLLHLQGLTDLPVQHWLELLVPSD